MARILVCDDDRDIVSALCIYLGAEGHETVRAYCGKEYDAKVKEGIPAAKPEMYSNPFGSDYEVHMDTVQLPQAAAAPAEPKAAKKK